MSSYITIILYTIILFPFITLIITLPYMIINYHKYGSVSFFRTLIVYTFILKPLGLEYLQTISFILIIAFLSVDFKENITMLYLGICFVCCVLAFFAIAHNEKKNEENFIPEPISYIVYIEDNADYKTLVQNYTIESEQDNLTTIVLKEN